MCDRATLPPPPPPAAPVPWQTRTWSFRAATPAPYLERAGHVLAGIGRKP